MNIMERAIQAREKQVADEAAAEAARKEAQRLREIAAESDKLIRRAREILGVDLDPASLEAVSLDNDNWTVTAEIDGRTFRPCAFNGYHLHLEVLVAAEVRPGYEEGKFVNFMSLAELGRLFIEEAELKERQSSKAPNPDNY